jgi:hypothetical protein
VRERLRGTRTHRARDRYKNRQIDRDKDTSYSYSDDYKDPKRFYNIGPITKGRRLFFNKKRERKKDVG